MPSARPSRLPWTAWRMARAKPDCRAKKPSARERGPASRRRLKSKRSSSASSRAASRVGFTVEIDNVRAFLPGSLVDVRPVRDPSYLENKPLEFKVIKLDQKRNNVVVSRRAVVEQEYSAERSALLDNLQEGAAVKGVVKNLTDYGAFVDLGGIDGLLHITDMAWKRVKHPSEVVKVGEEIDVRILKFDRERQRVSLGPEAARRGSRGRTSPAVIRPTPGCSARSPTSPTMAASWKSKKVSRASCTCRKWTGPIRT